MTLSPGIKHNGGRRHAQQGLVQHLPFDLMVRIMSPCKLVMTREHGGQLENMETNVEQLHSHGSSEDTTSDIQGEFCGKVHPFETGICPAWDQSVQSVVAEIISKQPAQHRPQKCIA